MSENKFIQHLKGKGTAGSLVEVKNQSTPASFGNMPQGTSESQVKYADVRGDVTVVANGTMNWKISNSNLVPASVVSGDGQDFTSTYSVSGAGLWINATYTFPSTGDPNHPVAMIFNPNSKWVLKLCGDNLVVDNGSTVDLTLVITFGTTTIISKQFTIAEQANQFCKELVIDFAESNTNMIKAQGLSTLKVQVLCGTANASARIYNGMTVFTVLQRKVDAAVVSGTFANVEEALRDGILPSDYFNNLAFISQIEDGDSAYAVFTRDGDTVALSGWAQPIPDQTNNTGKFLTTDGSLMSWAQLTISDVDGLSTELSDLQDQIDTLSGRGRFLSLWNCVTGLPETDPETESPYVYHTGDYYIVGTVSSATPAVNYKPSGSSYVFDPAPVPSSVVETGEVSVNDTYVYDGENWILQSNAQKEVSFSALAGSPYDNTALETALNSKQNTLTAGTNIDITNNVISATAQESFFRGNWNNWTLVPTSANNYPADYKGNKTPTYGDFLIVKDASDYVGSDKNYNFKYKAYHQISINDGDYVTISRGYTYTDGDVTFTISKVIYTYTVVCNVDVYLNGVLVPANTSIVSWSEGQPVYTFNVVATDTETYEGAWRFAYYGIWDTDGKLGWKPEYLVEDVLPTADSATAGIAKLYTTTGNNTDGAIDQNGTTTAINTAVSTHNTASNAHSNIRGTANGLATLDGNAKVPLTQINDALLGNVSYQGLWNAATNDPLLPDPSGGLPSGYQALGYIDLNGGYIDTLISFDSSTDEIQYDFNLEITPSGTVANRRIFGAASGGNGYDLANSAGSLYNRHNWEPNYFASAGSNQSVLNNVSRIDSNTFKMVLNRTNNAMAVYVNGSLNANISVTQGTYTTNTVYVGTCHLDSGAATNICPNQRYQYFKITKDGVLAGDFRPAKRLADGVIGFFDVVSNTFFTNLGSGTFTGGGSIEIPKGHYYITSTAGTQFGIHFEVGDWVISNGTSWTKVDNTDAVSSVEGRTGNVTVINDSVSTGATTYTWSADKLATQFGSLGTAAYTASTDYATAAQGAKADTALQPADVQEYTANEVETLWNSI